MLNLDISQLSDEEVTKVVTSETASFGTVKRVGIHRTADPTGNQFALIDMSSPEEANRVLSGLGDAMLGGSVVIRFIPHNTTQQPSAAGMPRVDFRKSFEGQLSRLDEPLMKEFTRHFSEDIEKFVSGITSAAYT
jgi:hypothetical protein